jgi:hypothetical protein
VLFGPFAEGRCSSLPLREWIHHARTAENDVPEPGTLSDLAKEPATSVDVTSSDMLARLDACLRQNGIELCLAEMKHLPTDKLRYFELLDQLGEESFDASLGAVVDPYLGEHIGD